MHAKCLIEQQKISYVMCTIHLKVYPFMSPSLSSLQAPEMPPGMIIYVCRCHLVANMVVPLYLIFQ